MIIHGWHLGALVALFTVVSIMIFLLINLTKYNWKNGELKTRIGLQVFGWCIVAHIVTVQHGHQHMIFFDIALLAFLYVVMRNFLKKPEHD